MNSKHFRIGFAIVLSVTLVSVITEWRGLFRIHFIAYDYAFFYYAFQAVLHHHTAWSQMYNLQLQQVLLRQHHFPIQPYNQYVYPPQFAVFFAGFGALPFGLSAALWMLMTTGLYICGVFWLVKLFWLRVRRIHLLAILVLAACLTPFEADIGVGNVNSLLFAAESLTFYLLYRHRRADLAGIPLGLAILFKVTPAAFLLVFVLRRQWAVCRSTLITILVVTLMSIPFVGISPMIQYLLHFSSFGHTSMHNGAAPFNQSLIGVLEMFAKHHWIHWSSRLQSIVFDLVCAVALYFIYAALKKRQFGDWRLDIALSSLMPIFFSPLVEEAHMVFVLPALAAFAQLAHHAYATGTKRNRRVAIYLIGVTAVSVLMLSLPTTFVLNFVVSHWPQLFWVHIQMYVVLMMLFITSLCLYHSGMVVKYGARAQRANAVREREASHHLNVPTSMSNRR